MRIYFLRWLLFAGTSVILFGTIYAVAQQGVRSSANDPQVQVVGDAVAELMRGEAPATIVPIELLTFFKALPHS